MTYLSYSEGFKGGGWNSHFNAVLTPAQQAALHQFKPEEAQTIELGTKLDLAGNTLRLNLAVFTSDYKDMQLTYRGPAPAGVAPFVTNAGKTSIDGAEARAHLGAHDATCSSRPAWVISTRPSTSSTQHSVRGAAAGTGGRQSPALCARMDRRTWASATRRMPARWKSCRASMPRTSRRPSSMRPTRVEIAQINDVTTVNAAGAGARQRFEVALHRRREQCHRRDLSCRRQFLAHHRQRLRGDRLCAAA